MESQTGFDGWAILAFMVAAGLLITGGILGRRGTTSRTVLAGWVTAKVTLSLLAGIAYGAFTHANGASTMAAAGIIFFFPMGLVIAAVIPGVVYLLASAILPKRWQTVAETGARRTLRIANGVALVLAVASFAVGYYFVR